MNSEQMDLVKRIFNISSGELKPVMASFFYFFFLMSSYFILRPVRDEMGIQAGVENMQWLFTGTFITMLLIVPVFGYLMKRYQRQKLIPGIYIFFCFNILVFYVLFTFFTVPFVSIIFFIWLSVFNLFVISIFWSFNADIFSSDQAKRLYGPIAAGGSSGAIFGPVIASSLAGQIGVTNLLLISALLLGLATYFLKRLIKHSNARGERKLVTPIKGSIWEGLKLMIRSPYLKQIGLFVLLYTCISTFLYFEQAHIISEAFAVSEDRTSYFGFRDLLVNSSTLFLQFFITERFLRKAGIIFCLILVPVVASFGFLSLGISQSVIVLLIVQVLYRSLNFSIQRPSREVLFTKVSVREKYNTKNFIDTALYRGGDALSGWLFAGLSALASLQAISFLAIPLTVVWALSGLRSGRLFNSMTFNLDNNELQDVITKKSA
ncbi:ATP:ADP antiporter, AAA family [Ekhidna lutea]|uniref:ATP:ADP antiporter, AAA family n=1 Tax=Ekhidna lutea TaxID=447679 RepID=A0A239KSB6_EKHLU|nr:ATP:ADP antiporter, AAA family [Ekhidna lutea]